MSDEEFEAIRSGDSSVFGEDIDIEAMNSLNDGKYYTKTEVDAYYECPTGGYYAEPIYESYSDGHERSQTSSPSDEGKMTLDIKSTSGSHDGRLDEVYVRPCIKVMQDAKENENGPAHFTSTFVGTPADLLAYANDISQPVIYFPVRSEKARPHLEIYDDWRE